VHESTTCGGYSTVTDTEKEYDIPCQSYEEVGDQPARRVTQCTSQIRCSHSHKNSTPCGQTAKGDRAPHTHVHVSTYIYMHIPKYIYIYIHAYIHSHIYIYIHTHTYIHVRTYTYTHIHTYIHI